jgi:hypothetical protein
VTRPAQRRTKTDHRSCAGQPPLRRLSPSRAWGCRSEGQLRVTEKCLHDVDVDPCPATSGGRAVPASRPGLSIPRANRRGRTSWRPGPCHRTRTRSSPRCLTWPTCLTPRNSLPPGTSQDPGEISYATTLVNAGMNLQALMALLGHVTPEMTLRYASLANTTVRSAYDVAMGRVRQQRDLPLVVAGRPVAPTVSNGSAPRCSKPGSPTAAAPATWQPRHALTRTSANNATTTSRHQQ